MEIWCASSRSLNKLPLRMPQCVIGSMSRTFFISTVVFLHHYYSVWSQQNLRSLWSSCAGWNTNGELVVNSLRNRLQAIVLKKGSATAAQRNGEQLSQRLERPIRRRIMAALYVQMRIFDGPSLFFNWHGRRLYDMNQADMFLLSYSCFCHSTLLSFFCWPPQLYLSTSYAVFQL